MLSLRDDVAAVALDRDQVVARAAVEPVIAPEVAQYVVAVAPWIQSLPLMPSIESSPVPPSSTSLPILPSARHCRQGRYIGRRTEQYFEKKKKKKNVYFVRLRIAAKRYGLYPRKGTIAIGADADIVLWDAKKEVTITHAMLQDGCDYTPYEGMQITGWPARTILRGRTVMRDGELFGTPGYGEEIPRNN